MQDDSNPPGFPQRGPCATCGAREKWTPVNGGGYTSPVRIEQHHIRPRAMGGDNRKRNLIPLCQSCHREVHRLYRVMGLMA